MEGAKKRAAISEGRSRALRKGLFFREDAGTVPRFCGSGLPAAAARALPTAGQRATNSATRHRRG